MAGAVIVRTDCCPTEIAAGLKVAVKPAGNPDRLNVAIPTKPLDVARLTV